MSDAPNKRNGRPFKAAAPGTRAPLGLKVTAATKAAIEDRAKASGRTQSQEAELLIEMGLAFLNSKHGSGAATEEPRTRKILTQEVAKALAAALFSEEAAFLVWNELEDRISEAFDVAEGELCFFEDGSPGVMMFSNSPEEIYLEERGIALSLDGLFGPAYPFMRGCEEDDIARIASEVDGLDRFISLLRSKKVSMEATAEVLKARIARRKPEE